MGQLSAVMQAQAKQAPERVAYRMIPSGLAVTWFELEQRTRRCAVAMLEAGLKEGDCIAVYLENHARYFEILWAAHRIGLYYAPISLHLKQNELEYIVKDCGAKLLFLSRQTLQNISSEWLATLSAQSVVLESEPKDGVESDSKDVVGSTPKDALSSAAKQTLGARSKDALNYEAWLATIPLDVVLPEVETEGTDFCYSSGTTGVPKGIKRPLQKANAYFQSAGDPRTRWKEFGTDSVYLSTAPFYHAAPVRWNLSVIKAGGTSLIMTKFDSALALQTIERYRVTHGQWVPTMFARMLRLPEAERKGYDLSSLRFVIHAAAPCPVPLKQQVIDWFGPIVYEYYAGTELVGRTSIASNEWLAHRGSVGRAEFGAVHIVDQEGVELGVRQNGVIYFSGGGTFEYHNDPVKTRLAYNERGWATYGDIGYLDEEGYLYLTDRLANTIVSGGVNIYPQEAENILSIHPAVKDVAVVGVPDEEFGESVKAVVELIDASRAGPELERDLIAFCRAQISALKCPKSIDFVQSLPRTEAGKLIKREVRDQYWKNKGQSRIAH